MSKIEIICSVIAAIACVLGGVWFIVRQAMQSGADGKRLDHVENAHRDIKDSVQKLPCTDHLSQMVELKTSLSYMQKSIDLLIQGKAMTPFVQSHSPVSLTKKGYEIADKLKIEDMVNSNWTNILYFLQENMNADNPYDIQAYLMKYTAVYPEKFLKTCDLDKIKNEAYLSGIPLMPYMNIVAVLIRDRYFTENDIDPNDVDKYDPLIKK